MLVVRFQVLTAAIILHGSISQKTILNIMLVVFNISSLYSCNSRVLSRHLPYSKRFGGGVKSVRLAVHDD
jgi:hypothetical protein